MIIREIVIKKDIGSVECALIVQRSMRYAGEILLEHGAKKVNCKSVMGMISLGLKKGDAVIIIIKGDDEDAALSDMFELFDSF